MSLAKAKEVLKIEAQAISDMAKRINKNFIKAVDLIGKCQGRVIVTGMGKTGIIGRKISATLSSTGTPSIWMHSAEAVHGDLGQVTKQDVLIIISNSGETEETKRLLPLIKKMNSKIIAMTGNIKSELAKYSDVVLDVAVKKEGCPLGLAPMASTTATLAMGDALAACLIVRKGFKKEDFALYHPGGSLGRKLLMKVSDLMRTGSHCPKVKEHVLVKNVLFAITKARCGSACVINAKGKFMGIFTDGDLRRHIESDPDLLNRPVKSVMTKNPITISKDKLAVEALNILEEKNIDELPVLDAQKKLVGLIDVSRFIKGRFGMSQKAIAAKLKKIKLLIMDVDGVLTKGEIIYDHKGQEIKIFDVQDGFGIVLFRNAGYKTAIISARGSAPVQARAKDLRIDEVYLDAHPKEQAYEKVLKSLNLKDEQVCFIGDDLPDIGVLKRVGLAVTVPNAAAEVKKIAHYTTKRSGGHGAVRELVELILKAQGKWSEIKKLYNL